MKSLATEARGESQFKGIQALRFIAASSVVYFHIGANTQFGSFGVDIFFVISGYVIGLVVERGQSSKDFVISRIARVVPLYWLMTSLILMIALVIPGLLNSTTADLSSYLKSLFFIPYFRENGLLMPLLSVGWTLNYEMFFYLTVWTALLILRPWYGFYSVGIILLAFVLLGIYSENRVLNSFFGNSIILEFILGIMVYKASIRGYQKYVPKFIALFAVVACLVFMAIAEAFKVSDTRLVIYGIPSTVLVYCILVLEDWVVNLDARLAGLFVTLGDASYSTYLSHYYVVEAYKRIIFEKYMTINPHSFIGITIIMVSALVIGQIIYVMIDKPLSKRSRKVLNSIC